MGTHRGRTLIAFAIVYIVWGSTYLAIRIAVETIPPFFLSASRALFAGALLLGIARWRQRGRAVRSKTSAPTPPRAGAHWKSAFIMGFLMFVLGNSILSWAETRIDSGLAALLVGSIPLWVAIIARFNPIGPRRAITLQQALGIGVGIFGLGLLVWPGSAAASGVHFDLFAIGFLFLGAMGWAFGTVIAPSLPHSSDKLEDSAMTMLAGGVMVLVASLIKGEFAQIHAATFTARSVAAWGYLVVFGSMIAYSAYVYIVAASEPTTVATYALVNPIVAVLLGWAMLGEVITPRMITATAIIVLGLGLTLFGAQAATWAGRWAKKSSERAVGFLSDQASRL